MTTTMTTDNGPDAEELALGVLDAILQHDLERIRDLVTDDFVDHGSPVLLPPGPTDTFHFLTFVTEVLQIQYTVDDIIASNDTVAITGQRTALAPSRPSDIEATGLPYAMKTAHFYRSRDGRLWEHWGIEMSSA